MSVSSDEACFSDKAFEVRIVAVEPLAPDIAQIWLRRSDGNAITFRPGQYLVVEAQRYPDVPLMGAFSLCEPPRADGQVAICVKRTGAPDCAALLHQSRAGDLLRCAGPRGSLVLPHELAHDLVLIAAGTGIAPFHAMYEQLKALAADRSVWLLHGARRPGELLFRSRWLDLARERARWHYHPVVSRPLAEDAWQGAVGRLNGLVEQLPLHDPEGLLVYLCGQEEMIDALTAALTARGVPMAAIRRET